MEKKEKPITSEDRECTICHEHFESLQEVYKHELLDHSSVKSPRNLPVNKLKRKLNAVLKTINNPDEKKNREELTKAISECTPGLELNVIFKKYQLDNERLLFIHERVQTCLEKELGKIGKFSIQAFGSVSNGLALKTSDIDFHITCRAPHINPSLTYRNITKMLYRSKCFSDIFPIRKARVPIIKCIHKVTGFSLDINTCEPFGVHNSKFIYELNNCDTRIHQFMLFLKIWSKNMHMSGSFGMNNYCLITLGVFYLQNSDPPVLPSVKIMQRNGPKYLVNGINFGVNTRNIPLDSSQDKHELIKGFFKFYSSFDFENNIIAPYLGKSIKRHDFQNEAFKYPEYEAQLRMLTVHGEVEQLQTDRPVCIQDMFCLNVNVGKCFTDIKIQYFKRCVTLSHRKCSDQCLSQKDLYIALLVGIVEEMSEMNPPKDPEPTNSGSTLEFTIFPRKNELKSLAKFSDNPLDVRKQWVQEYTDAIVQIITEVYKIKMTPLSPTLSTKCKKLDESKKESVVPMASKWLIQCNIDLWTGRQMQRNSTISFMEYQLAQTDKLFIERQQKNNFAVQFSGYLTVKIVDNYNLLKIEATSNGSMCKKDPFRKFFGTFKCCMQNYNLKQRIFQLEEGR